MLVFMHPLGTRELEPSGRLGGSGLLTNTIGNPLETTIALSHLIFEGTLDRFPGLKICAAHGGGFLPSYANRSDAVIRCFPDRVGPLPKKNPTAYLRDGQLFFDTIVFTPEALRHLIAETGSGQIMIGTDYPFPWTSTEVDLVLNTPGLSDDERIAILGGTAARLLGIASWRVYATPAWRHRRAGVGDFASSRCRAPAERSAVLRANRCPTPPTLAAAVAVPSRPGPAMRPQQTSVAVRTAVWRPRIVGAIQICNRKLSADRLTGLDLPPGAHSRTCEHEFRTIYPNTLRSADGSAPGTSPAMRHSPPPPLGRDGVARQGAKGHGGAASNGSGS